MNSRTILDLLARHKAVFELSNGGSIILKNPQKFVSQTLDQLVVNAVFGETEEVRSGARWIIRRAGLELGVVPSSIQGLYEARARKECKGFTVPSINVRGLSYDVARAVFRAALRLKAGAFIFELTRTESYYTDQPPAEYAAVIVAAALREGFEGPVFVQGDHYKVNANKFAKDPESELQGVRDFSRNPWRQVITTLTSMHQRLWTSRSPASVNSRELTLRLRQAWPLIFARSSRRE